MQFAVESPRWLCKVWFSFHFDISWVVKFLALFLKILSYGCIQVGMLDGATEVIRNLWGDSEVDNAIEEFQSVIKNDGSDTDSQWLELLEEPNSRGCIKVV